jgi:Tol biopolymer transport system component
MKTVILLLSICLLAGCSSQTTNSTPQAVPHQEAWGVYVLNLATEAVELIHSTSREIHGLNLNGQIQKLCFAQKVGGDGDANFEIISVGVDGTGLTQLTNNSTMDTYPSFSPDGSQIAFLAWGSSTLDIYRMNADGSSRQLLYGSGGHDADADWGGGGRIVFTRNSQVWTINENGTDPQRLTDPANAGDWGIANLPIGDYDPRFNSDGSKVAFERMDDVAQANGGYNIYTINLGGTGEAQLTTTTYTQGFPNWSSDDSQIVFIVGAISGAGTYDIYLMNADGSNARSIMPSYFPAEFLAHNAVFSSDDSKVYFVGQWYQ